MIIIKVWEVRVKKKLTLRQLSKLTGITKSTLNNIENNRVDPKLSQLAKIAQALKVPIEELYESVLDKWTVAHLVQVLGNRTLKYFNYFVFII